MRAVLLSLFLLSACSAPSPQGTRIGDLEITAARASPSPNGVDVAAGFLTITNHGAAPDRLIAASSPRARNVELHSMEMDGPVMRMRQVESLDIPAGGAVSLTPGGDHLMFMGVTAPFTAGETIPIRLSFEHNGEAAIALPVGRETHH